MQQGSHYQQSNLQGSMQQQSNLKSVPKPINRLKAINYKKKEVGKHIKSTKTKYKWKVEVNGRLHKIVLADSSWGKKRRIYHNKELIFEKKKDKHDFVETFHSSYPDKTPEAEFIILEEGKKKKYNLLVDKYEYSDIEKFPNPDSRAQIYVFSYFELKFGVTINSKLI